LPFELVVGLVAAVIVAGLAPIPSLVGLGLGLVCGLDLAGLAGLVLSLVLRSALVLR